MRSAVIALVAASCVFGQTFEVVSVKPNNSGDGRIGINRPDDIRFTTMNTPLKVLITFAYDIRDTQLMGGPAWINSDRWDIVATVNPPVARTQEGAAVIRKMLQTLIEERFHLKLHKESKEMGVSVLVLAKGGSKLKESDPASPVQMRGGLGDLEGTRIAMPMFARALSSQVGGTVTDGTGLKGEYDVKIHFAPDPGSPMAQLAGPGHPESVNAESDRPALRDALQEQLGLKLESHKEMVDLYVIDSAEKPEAN